MKNTVTGFNITNFSCFFEQWEDPIDDDFSTIHFLACGKAEAYFPERNSQLYFSSWFDAWDYFKGIGWKPVPKKYYYN